MHCARAVHVQMFYTCNSFAAPTAQTVGTADARSAGHMSAIPAYMFFWLPFGVGCRLRAPGPGKFIREGSSGSRKF